MVEQRAVAAERTADGVRVRTDGGVEVTAERLLTSAGGVDLHALMAQRQDLVDGLRQAKYAGVADAHGFPVRYGHARFPDDRTLEVDGEPVVAAAYVVATGAAPHVPDLPGIDDVDQLWSCAGRRLRRRNRAHTRSPAASSPPDRVTA